MKINKLRETVKAHQEKVTLFVRGSIPYNCWGTSFSTLFHVDVYLCCLLQAPAPVLICSMVAIVLAVTNRGEDSWDKS
jgi:hypothetical protein